MTSMRTYLYKLLPFILVLALVGVACGNDEEVTPPEGAAADDLAPEKTSIRLMPTFSAHFLPYFVADEKGFFNEYGLDVEILEFEGGAARATEALFAGEAELGYTSWPLAFSLAARGQQLKFITHTGGYYARHEGVDYGAHELVVLENSPIRTVADLESARIGVIARGSNEEAFLAHILEEVGVDFETVELVEAFWGDHPSLLEAGRIDVGYMIYPFAGAVLPYPKKVANGFRSIGDPYLGGEQGIPEMFGDEGAGIFPVVATEQFVAENPNTIRAFALAHRDATAWIEQNPEEALDITEEVLGLPGGAQQNNPPYLFVTAHPEIIERMEFVAEVMVDAGLLDDVPDLKRFVSDLPFTEEEVTELGQFFSWHPADL